MKKYIVLIGMLFCNQSYAWSLLDRCSDAYSCSPGGLLLKGTANKYLDYQEKKEHDAADTHEKKFQYLKKSAENIVSTNSNDEKTTFNQVVGEYLTIISAQTEPEAFKVSLVNECFTKETDKSKNGICTFNKYLNTYQEIDTKEKEIKRLAYQKQAEQEALKKRAKYKKELAKGIPKTEYNIRRYCQASANIVVDAYVNAALQAQVGASSPRFNRANEELLDITRAQENKLIMNASDDAERAVVLSRNYMLQNRFSNEYATKCFANPKTMIINYNKIFKN